MRMLNPILPFTMDELNSNLPGERKENVQFLSFPKVSHKYDDMLSKEYNLFTEIKDIINKALEEKKNSEEVKSSQEASVIFYTENDEYLNLLNKFSNELLKSSLLLSSIQIVKSDETKVEIIHHHGKYCHRCRNYDDNAVKVDEETYLCPRCWEVLKKNGKI